MIQLKTDCLVFETDHGEHIPCSAEWVSFELMGDGAQLVDPEMVRHASAAVLHYFKHEMRRQSVSVGEFAEALERVLRSFGLSVHTQAKMEPQMKPESPRVLEFDLKEMASNAASEGFELLFFPQLRQVLKRNLDQGARVLRFHDLRGCVKQLAGTERWSGRCQKIHDQIVEFIRSCWETEPARRSCKVLVI